MKRLFTFALILVMVLSLSSCALLGIGNSSGGKTQENPEAENELSDLIKGLTDALNSSDEKDILGTWSKEISMEDEIFDELDDEDIRNYFDFSGITLTLLLTFDEEGECTFGVDPDSIEAMVPKLLTALKSGFTKYIAAVAEEYGMSADELLEAMEYDSVEEFTEDVFDVDEFSELMEDLYEESTSDYEFKNGKLYIDDDDVDYEISGSSLTLTIDGFEDIFGTDRVTFKKV